MRTIESLTDAEVAAWYEQNKETYRIGERRKVRYLLLDVQALRNNITVPEQDIQRDIAQQGIDRTQQLRQELTTQADFAERSGNMNMARAAKTGRHPGRGA